MARTNMKVGKHMAATIQRHVEHGEKKATADTIQEVATFLKEHPEQATPCLMALRSGWFSKRALQQRDLVIPKTRTQIRLLSLKFIKHRMYKQ
eukprot:523906-Lingulodinium_polyedra.AAC.1